MTSFLLHIQMNRFTIKVRKQWKESTMLSNNEEVQGKINDFIRRKREQYPDLDTSL